MWPAVRRWKRVTAACNLGRVSYLVESTKIPNGELSVVLFIEFIP